MAQGTNRRYPTAALAATLLLAACGGNGSSGYPLAINVTGLSGESSLVVGVSLASNGGTADPVSGSTVVASDGVTVLVSEHSQLDYQLSVIRQPSGQICTPSAASGSLKGNTTIAVSCVATTPGAVAWDWVGGPNVANISGVYGMEGTASTANAPGARQGTTGWGDTIGNLWLFGGYSVDSTGAVGTLNDLWYYNASAGTWTWVNGSKLAAAAAVYGSLGVPAATNVPGARAEAASWTDAAGNLWLFGGGGNSQGSLNDLWEFNVASGLWTWMGGGSDFSARGTYGQLGVASSNNMPGARFGAVTWRDTHGNLWLFGGAGFDSSGQQGDLNDLWMYNPPSGSWTWVSGSNLANAASVFGSQGVAAAGNVPGARQEVVAWVDATDTVWLFGGLDWNGGLWNDLWKFTPTTGLWTWVNGAQTANAPASYGVLGTSAAGNVPGARNQSVSWTDDSGTLWLFGGNGHAIVQTQGSLSEQTRGTLNDLWKFVPAEGTWTWEDGSPVPGASPVNGTLGVAAFTNTPGARFGALSWRDPNGDLWLFGGVGLDSSTVGSDGYLSDLWRFTP